MLTGRRLASPPCQGRSRCRRPRPSWPGQQSSPSSRGASSTSHGWSRGWSPGCSCWRPRCSPSDRCRAAVPAASRSARWPGCAAWSALSLTWAPLGGPAIEDVQRLVLYALGLTAAAAWLREPLAARATEPALALGAFVVIGYGLSERMLPGVLDFARSGGAGGRLEQPLTYWNAMGALAAFGLVLATRVAGDAARRPVVRAFGAALVPTLAAGIYLTFSRGALLALAAGAVTLLALAPERSQARAGTVAIVAGLLAVALARGAGRGPRGGRRGDRAGPRAPRRPRAAECRRGRRPALARPPGERAAAAGRSAAAPARGRHRRRARRAARRRRRGGGPVERGRRRRRPRLRLAPRHARVLPLRLLAGRGRLPSPTIRSPVPVTASFRVDWQRERGRRDAANDAHSLYLETLGELGLVGFALLMAFVAGVAVSARRAFVRDRAPGPPARSPRWRPSPFTPASTGTGSCPP